MQLFIRNIPNLRLIHISENDSILDVKKKIEKRSTLPIRFQNIMFQGKYLSNSKYIKDYSISNDDTLHVHFRIYNSEIPTEYVRLSRK